MRTTPRWVAVLAVLAGVACGLALAAPGVRAQALGHVVLAPTYQQSVAAYQSRTDPLGHQQFHAWGFMVGVERPGRFWQPHLWLQRYEFGRPCVTSNDRVDCMNEGWALSVGPGLQILSVPRLSGTFLPQVGFQPGDGSLTGGAGLHIDVELGGIGPSGFARYQVIRGVHFATVGVGLVIRLPLQES